MTRILAILLMSCACAGAQPFPQSAVISPQSTVRVAQSPKGAAVAAEAGAAMFIFPPFPNLLLTVDNTNLFDVQGQTIPGTGWFLLATNCRNSVVVSNTVLNLHPVWSQHLWWTPTTNLSAVGFWLYYLPVGSTATQWPRFNIASPNTTNCVLFGLTGVQYQYKLTIYDAGGLQSADSNLVIAVPDRTVALNIRVKQATGPKAKVSATKL